MNVQYILENRLFGGTFAPQGWDVCNGNLLPIHNNQDFYSLLGIMYGGDGVTNFSPRKKRRFQQG